LGKKRTAYPHSLFILDHPRLDQLGAVSAFNRRVIVGKPSAFLSKPFAQESLIDCLKTALMQLIKNAGSGGSRVAEQAPWSKIPDCLLKTALMRQHADIVHH
jgi:hypothetical protein